MTSTDNVSVRTAHETVTWDDAVGVVKDAVDQILDMEAHDGTREAHLYIGYLQAGALAVLGALLLPHDEEGDGSHTIYELISLGAQAVDVELDDEEDDES